MRTKVYSPVKIQDPTEGHLVPLKPNQGFVLSLKGQNPDIECNSQFFRLDRKETVKGNDGCLRTLVHFRQLYDLTEQSKYSQLYLGEIDIIADGRHATLHVFVHCAADLFMLTVINPEFNFIKLYSGMTLRVILPDIDKFNWKYTIVSGDKNIRFKEMNHVCYQPPKFKSICDETVIKEHHYWFRLDDKALLKLDCGQYQAGKIVFFKEIGNLIRTLNIQLRVRPKPAKKKVFENQPNQSIIYPQENSYSHWQPGHGYNGPSKTTTKTSKKVYNNNNTTYIPQYNYKKEITLIKKDDTGLASNQILWF